MDVEEICFGKPPISVIGMDREHQREVSKEEVAQFANHLRTWREVFHGGYEVGVIVECGSGSAVLFEKGNMEGIEIRWGVILLGRYVVTRKVAERLLSGATACVVPLNEFVECITDEGGVSMWRLEEGRGEVGCRRGKEEVRASDKFPSHAPLHRWHERKKRAA